MYLGFDGKVFIANSVPMFVCHSRLSGRLGRLAEERILPTVRNRKKDSGQARMTEIRSCGRDHRV
jgi:hypothetical protein